jgi:hypothetical protein
LNIKEVQKFALSIVFINPNEVKTSGKQQALNQKKGAV